jgi:glyoxylase-like metal-dependent hydrolase (beta-lactamase superfamily II)
MVHVIDLNFQQTKESIAAFLVETSKGPILFETGPYSTFQTLEKEIGNLGFSIGDIKHVFVSHIHFDHAGAAWKFAEHGASIYVHPLGMPHLNNPEKLWGSAVRIYGNAMETLWGPMKPIPRDQLIALDHSSDTFIGDTRVQAYHTPGHAVHHLAFGVNELLFGGDVAGVRIGNGPVIAPCPPPDIHLEDWLHSIDLIKSLSPKKLYLTHFGLISGLIEEHLQELKANLLHDAHWVLNEMSKEKELSKIIDSYQEMTEEKWRMLHLSPQEILRYSLANPAFMSVSGLTRYWTKIKGISWN